MLHRASDLAGFYEHCNELTGSMKGGNFLTSCVTVSFSKRTLLYGVSHLAHTCPVSMYWPGIFLEDQSKALESTVGCESGLVTVCFVVLALADSDVINRLHCNVHISGANRFSVKLIYRR